MNDLLIFVVESVLGMFQEGLGFQIAFTSSKGGPLQRKVFTYWKMEEERVGKSTPQF